MAGNGLWSRPFSVVTDGETHFIVAKIDEKTAKRCAALVEADGGRDALAKVVADALNLHAMPGLIAKAFRG